MDAEREGNLEDSLKSRKLKEKGKTPFHLGLFLKQERLYLSAVTSGNINPSQSRLTLFMKVSLANG